MGATKASLIVSLCLAVCLAGLAVAHVQVRQETARLRRAVRNIPDVPAGIEQDIESLQSELRKLKYRADDVDLKVDCSAFEDLKEEVASIRGSALEAHARISEFPDSSDLVQKYELNSEVRDLDKRIEAIEDKLGIRRY